LKILFRGEFCNETSEDISVLTEHEKGCFYNPKNKTCGTCIHSSNDFGDYSCKDCIGTYYPLDHAIWNCAKYEEEKYYI
jgi:hypothetical protein